MREDTVAPPVARFQEEGRRYLFERWGRWAQHMDHYVRAGPAGPKATERKVFNQKVLELWSAAGGLLAWDKGSGKTLGALHIIDSWVAWVRSLGLKTGALQGALMRPVLIVSQARGRHVWQREALKFYPHLAAQMVTPLTGPEFRRAARSAAAGETHILSVSYTMLAQNVQYLDAACFSLCVCDEIQELGSCTTEKSQALYQLMRVRPDGIPGLLIRLGLSGTPTTNKIDKLWPVLAYLQGLAKERKTKKGTEYTLWSPGWLWDTRASFEERYCQIEENAWGQRFFKGINLVHDPVQTRSCGLHTFEQCNCLHPRLVRTLMHRVTRQEAWPQLPQVSIEWEEVPLAAKEEAVYDRLVEDEVMAAVDEQGRVMVSDIERLALMTYAFEAAVSSEQLGMSLRHKYGEGHTLALDGKPVTPQSSKLDWIVDFMADLDDQAAVLVFTEFSHFAKEIATDPRLAQYEPLLLAGTGKLTAEKAERLFQEGPSRMFVATMMGSTALTLTKASYVVMAGKFSWGPQDWQQAIARMSRPGQQAQRLSAHLLYAPDTIEAWLRGKLARKLEDSVAVLDGKWGGAEELSIAHLSDRAFLDAFRGR